MVGLDTYSTNQMGYSSCNGHADNGVQAVKVALQMYHNARLAGQLGQAWGKLTGASRRLLDLADVRAACPVRSSHYAGTRAVPMHQIRGSEGRCEDFDADFRPLQTHSKGRWVNVAAARERRMGLPPVALIQVGDVYFVRDGHHRISVAKALGEEAVDAEVTVLDVAGPLPWERRTATGKLASQPA
ncbi:MAG: hypothetical protein JXA14_00685 [Anaerolineae bacterium]|nr:hypothetical protein [Anaerolineae bacterium]